MRKPTFSRPLTIAAATIAMALPPATASLENGLVSYWAFDDDLLDATATGAHGTHFPGTGAPDLLFSAGKFGQGLDLNNFAAGAFDQYVEITGGLESTFDFTGASMSFSLWLSSPFIGVANQTILAKGDGPSWHFSSNDLDAEPAFSAGGFSAIGDLLLHPLDDSVLHHYVGIVESGVGVKLYRDGELISEASGSPNIADSPERLLIGGNPDAGGEVIPFRTWEGIFDDLGIWNRALTAGEVALLWNGGAGVPIGEAIDPTDSDNDGMPDFYENNTPGLDPADPADANHGANDGLFDNDGLTNLEEFTLGSDPNNADSDGDGLQDGAEVSGALNPFGMAPTQPLVADSDGDGLNDGEEVTGSANTAFGNDPTNPNESDTDNDGATDPQEIAFGFDPNDLNNSPPPMQRGLKGFWAFDQNLLDGSGLGFHGMMLGTNLTPRFTTGKHGRAILLDGRTGVNQSVQIVGSGSEFDSPGGSLTISTWVRLSIASNAEPNIVGKGGDNNWRLTLSSGSSELIYHGGSDPISGGGSIAGPFWRHVVAISEAGVATRLYLDGLLVAVGGPPDLGSNGLPMEIGGNPELFDMNWNGLVDDVAVWTRALTTGEVRQIWNAGLGVPIADLIVGTDGDSDGMSDAYESAHGLNPALDDAALDLDGDGLSNKDEHDAGSHPNDLDTDDDGLDDAAEAAAGTNPLGPDSDGDGLSDGEEISGSQNPFLNNVLRDPFDPNTDPPGDPTDPLNSDSDGDGFSDPLEMDIRSNPNDPSSVPSGAFIAVAENLVINLSAWNLPLGPIDIWLQIGDTTAPGEFVDAQNHPSQIPGFLAASNPFVEEIRAPLGQPSFPVPGTAGSPITVRAVTFTGDDGMLGPIAPAGVTGVDPTRTIEVWAYNSAIPSEECMVAWSERGGPNGSGMQMNYAHHPNWGAVSHWGGGFHDCSWTDNTNSVTGAPLASAWHHLVYTYDGSTTRVYMDSLLQNTEILGAGAVNTHAVDDDGTPLIFRLGHAREDNGNPGLVASLSLAVVRVHDGVLSEVGIFNNYLAGPNTPIVEPLPPELALVVHGLLNPTELSISAMNVPAGETFHIRESFDGQTFTPLSTPFNFDSGTAFPASIQVDSAGQPVRLYQIWTAP